MSARKFAAQYPGTCPACTDRIDVGDDLIYSDDEVVHFDCAGERPRLSLRAREVCPRCFTEKASNGSCVCEED